MKRLSLLALCLLATACMQSRKGIKSGITDSWVWTSVDFCNSFPDCDLDDTHLVGSLHYDENFMEFDVLALESEPYVELASDETLSYRFIAKRASEGSWHKLNWISVYGGSKISESINMQIGQGDKILLKPQVGYIEQYNRWILERVVQKGSEKVPYGNGDILFDIEVSYGELDTEE